MKHILRAIIPAILFVAALLILDRLVSSPNILPPSIKQELPTGFRLDGWYGVRTQESQMERRLLAADTKFSKAIYRQDYVPFGEKELPQINVSVIFSGAEMNNSIHRPEWCLPSQGHLDLQYSAKSIKMSNGKEYTFSRLATYTVHPKTSQKVHHIHYYIFVSHSHVTHSHNKRNLYDIWDRSIKASLQSWAYLQVGSYWAPELNISEEECDTHIQKLLSQLVPKIILNGL